MRAFVAIEMSEEIRAALAIVLHKLARLQEPVKWVPAQNLHLTLKFLGSIPDESVAKAVSIMHECAEVIHPFELTVKGLGGFPNLGRPRVIFADASDEQTAAVRLYGRLQKKMEALNVEREDRPFAYHVTLGRVREPKKMPELEKLAASFANVEFGRMRVQRISLMKSDLSPKGPTYTAVEQVELT